MISTILLCTNNTNEKVMYVCNENSICSISNSNIHRQQTINFFHKTLHSFALSKLKNAHTKKSTKTKSLSVNQRETVSKFKNHRVGISIAF